jgi:hypothetical protein
MEWSWKKFGFRTDQADQADQADPAVELAADGAGVIRLEGARRDRGG